MARAHMDSSEVKPRAVQLLHRQGQVYSVLSWRDGTLERASGVPRRNFWGQAGERQAQGLEPQAVFCHPPGEEVAACCCLPWEVLADGS